MADATGTRKRATRKKAEPKAADGNGNGSGEMTGYVILEQAESAGEIAGALGAGRVWIERPAQVRGGNGLAAIKAANLRADGSHAPGTFKAITGSTWNAESNNLGIQAEQKIVNTFVRGGAAAAKLTPEPTSTE